MVVHPVNFRMRNPKASANRVLAVLNVSLVTRSGLLEPTRTGA